MKFTHTLFPKICLLAGVFLPGCPAEGQSKDAMTADQVLISEARELQNPRGLFSDGRLDSFQLDSGQTQFFKFVIKPDFAYSIIAWGPDLQINNSTARFTLQRSRKAEEFSSVGRRTAIILRPDSTQLQKQTSYLSVQAFTSAHVKIKILELNKKIFYHPLRPADYGVYAMTYYTLFGARGTIGGKKTINGHDGIDICTAYQYAGNGFASGWMEDNPAVVAAADGEVIRVWNAPCKLGGMVWIKHRTPVGVYTSLYAHLKNISVTEGTIVKQGTSIGFMLEEPACPGGFYKHLHFEVWKGVSTTWSGGYSNGSSGQIDPLNVLFEK